MTFFQNVLTGDFEGNWVLGDRQHSPKFVVKRNMGRGDEQVVAWTEGPYDLSGNDADGTSADTLEIVYAPSNPKYCATMAIDITASAADASAVTPEEVIAALNADATFAERFVASLSTFPSGSKRIEIKQKKPITEMRFYINNGRAEEKIQFNARAGVAELPSYFRRHAMGNRFTYDDCQNHLIGLNISGSTVAKNIVINAVDHKGASLGFDGTTAKEDWQLLEGRSGLFEFQKGPSSNEVATTETVILYPAGATEGDLAEKVVTQKDASGDIVAKFSMPYTLTDSDLVTPP